MLEPLITGCLGMLGRSIAQSSSILQSLVQTFEKNFVAFRTIRVPSLKHWPFKSQSFDILG